MPITLPLDALPIHQEPVILPSINYPYSYRLCLHDTHFAMAAPHRADLWATAIAKVPASLTTSIMNAAAILGSSSTPDVAAQLLNEGDARLKTIACFFDPPSYACRGIGDRDIFTRHPQFEDLIVRLQYELLEAPWFNFGRLRAMRRIALMWTVRSWMKEYSLVFSPTEATKLKDFLSVAHPDGVARTFIGMVPWGLPWIVTLKNLPKGKRVPQLVYEYKKAKLCIEWNPVVRAWLHVLVDQPSGENDNPRSTDEVPRDQELSYFYFPGKLRTIPSSRLQPQPLWNCASISFLINCRALVPSTSLVINPSALLTGMQKAVQQRNLLALDVLCQLQRPSWPAFHYAMSADDVDAFKVLLMYGGQFPSPDEAVRLHAWAHYLQLSNGNGASVRRTRDEAYREDVARLVFGQWLCDFLDELPERRKTSRPLFVDGCVHDLEAWRKDRARLEKVFSNVRIDIEDEAGIQEEEERGETRSESENIPVGEN